MRGRRGGFLWLFGFAAPHWPRLGLILVLSLGASALALAQPYLTKRLIDDGLLAQRLDAVWWSCGLMLAAALAGAGLGALNRWHYLTLSGQVLFALRETVFAHLQRLPPDFFARRAAGDVLSRVDGDVAEIQRFSVDTVLSSVNAVIVLGATLALMTTLAPDLLLPALAALPVQIVALKLLRPRVERTTRAVRAASGDVSAFMVENLSTIKLGQAVGAEHRQLDRLKQLNRDYLRQLRLADLTGWAGGAVPGLLNGLAAAAVFLIGGAMVVRGDLSVGTLIAFTAYLARASGPVNTLMGLYVARQRAGVSLDRVVLLLDEPPAVTEPAHPLPLPTDARGEVRIEGISFGHGGRTILDGLSARLPAGAKIGLVGPSGIGKTTLIDLLHRHYDPTEGRILLDGIDLRRLSLRELRRRVCVVAQDVQLVSGTVAHNIRFAVPEAGDDAVAHAAAQALLDIDLDTEVGERGLALSGGERQRLAIARAILQDPLVLVLDEATSAVDQDRQRQIGAIIDGAFAGRTRLIVSHHGDVLANVDMTFELGPAGLSLRARAA